MRISEKQLQSLGDYQAWKEGENGAATLLEYACYTATPDQLFGYATVFFRQLVEVDHHYFFADAFDEPTYLQLKATLPNGREIQRVINELPMRKLLQSADVDDASAAACARLVADAWNEVHIRKGVTAEVRGATLADLAVTLVNLHE